MRRRKRFLLVALLVAAPTLFFVWRFYWLRWLPDKLVLSTDTTYITRPLDVDGYPDYYAALNERIAVGITSENNAAVLLLQALGPSILPSNIDQMELLRLLKMKSPANGPRYFEDWSDYARRLPPDEILNLTYEDRLWLIEAKITERPWRRVEFPQVARWLGAQQPYLDLMVAASKLSQFYAPLLPQEDAPLMLRTVSATVNAARAAVQALSIRALFRMGEQDFERAWDDLMACKRLARLVAQGPMIHDSQFGLAMDGDFFVDAAFLGTARIDAAKWAAMRAQFAALPAIPSYTEKLDLGRRFVCLDAVCFAARHGVEALDEALYGERDERQQPSPLEGLVGVIDWNVPLRMMNDWIDRYAAAAKLDDPLDRSATITALDWEAQSLSHAAAEKWPLASMVSQQAASQRIGEILIGVFFSAQAYAAAVEERSAAYRPLVEVGLALAHFHSENGSYPSRLGELTPRYLKSIPLDPFSERPFRYSKSADGYRLYSVGWNRKDEGGKGPQEDNQSDDLLIEVPWKPNRMNHP